MTKDREIELLKEIIYNLVENMETAKAALEKGLQPFHQNKTVDITENKPKLEQLTFNGVPISNFEQFGSSVGNVLRPINDINSNK